MTVECQRTEDRGQRTEDGRVVCPLSSVLCPLLVTALVAIWTVAHIGCHSDEDTELGVTPPVETRPTAAH